MAICYWTWSWDEPLPVFQVNKNLRISRTGASCWLSPSKGTGGLRLVALVPPPAAHPVVLCRRRAFRYTPGILERNAGQEENVDGSPVPPYLAKTSSSEWNSSDDLAGPSSEHEESSNVESLSPGYRPPAPPKTFDLSCPDLPAASPPSPEPLTQSSPRNQPRNGPSLLSHSVLRRWIETPPEHRFSSDTSSKSGSSDHDRNDLSASESEERAPSPKLGPGEAPDPPGGADVVLPTTYFSVDNCMTDTYRAKYHRRPARVAKAEEHASSGESDAEGRRLPPGDAQLGGGSRPRPESGTLFISALLPEGNVLSDQALPPPGHPAVKATARWNPVTPKGLDEHGFL